ncbi:hypothetical protein J7337_010226 [Fusarium musae]|uniref:Gfo/Idh/MocA-like oxidoreductase N-terminal domain-containing protein n=1 Tax=Fusarium musae TaxID=1042133 RepID=A0A9P8D8S5_9HYPO|nr:hypothetical protein J7337_010226 [Fusarium musae]KAG9497366.1 hypothetical protein J7337_010226 [Fusarium musae]
MAPQKLKIAAAGLGRIGKRHAINFLSRTPRAELVAAFTPDPTEMAWAKVNLEPHGVKLYDDYQTMIEQEGLQAVVIGTATSVHAEEAIQAMQKDLHVLCEKPLFTSIEVRRQVIAEAKKLPHLEVMCGFSRRFDDSYRDAFSKTQQGAIGRPTIIRSRLISLTKIICFPSIFSNLLLRSDVMLFSEQKYAEAQYSPDSRYA